MNVDDNPHCLYGWATPKGYPRTYSGGCGCWLPYRHEGKCICGDDSQCKSKMQRPADWDDKQRKECNS